MTPLNIRRLVAFVLLLLIIHGYGFCDFVPSYDYLFVSIGLAALFGIAVTASLLVFKMRHGGGPEQSAFVRIIAYTFCPIFFGGWVWFAVGKSLPGLITSLVGNPHVEETRMWKSRWFGSRGLFCSYELEGGAMSGTIPGYFCLSASDYERLSDANIVVRLSGKQSYLGFLVQKYEIVSDLGPSQSREQQFQR